MSAGGATLGLIAVTLILRAIVATQVGLGLGEAYYYSAARHPSLSYFDQPPATAFLGWLALQVGGSTSDLVLRAPMILLFAGATWLTFVLGRRLFGPWAGFWAAFLLNLVPVFTLSTGVFYQPESPLIFCWVATLCLLVPLLLDDPSVRNPRGRWLAAGAMLGLTMLSKYTAIFLVAGVVLFLLTSRDRRRWFTRADPYLAVLVAIACFTPVLAWNAQHDWLSLRWQGARGAAFQGIHLDWLLHNIGGQLIEILPWIWLPLLIEPLRAWRARDEERAPRLLLVCIGFPPVLMFTAVSAYANIGDHFHWAAVGYFTLLIGLGATIDHWVRRVPVRAMAGIGAMTLASVFFIGFLVIQSVSGRFSVGYGSLSRWLAHNDGTIELMDFGALVPAFRERGLLDRPGLFIFADRWYLAGKIDYAFRGKMPFYLFSENDPREYAFFEPSSRAVGQEGILVTQREAIAEIRHDYGSYCSSIDSVGDVPIVRSGKVEWTLLLYRCGKLLKPYPIPYR